MTAEPIDWANFNLSAMQSHVELSLRTATMKADLAQRWADVAAKQIANRAEIAEQQRIGQAYRDFLAARKKALSDLRRQERHAKILQGRIDNFKQLFTATSPQQVRHGYYGYRYLLQRSGVKTIDTLILMQADAEHLDDLRLKNKPLTHQARVFLGQLLPMMIADATDKANAAAEKLARLQSHADKLRSSDWNTAKIDTAWMK